MTPIPVVLDTNVLVSALLTPSGNPAMIYRMFLTQTLRLVYCPAILTEYTDVLFRPRLRIDPEDAAKVLEAIQEHGEQIDTIPSVFDMPDEDDRVFYDTAQCSGAYLVTGNTKHYPDEAFILTPAAFLELR